MSTSRPEGTSATAPADDLKLLVPSRSVPIGEGVSWIGEGWRLFAKAPLMWIVGILILFVIAIVINIVPFIGSLAFQLLNAVFSAGFVVACRSLERGGEFELEHLFAGFRTRFVNLLIVGALFLAGGIVITLIFAGVAGFGVIMALMSGNQDDALAALAGSAMMLLLGGLIMLALMVPLLMAYWFAPALVIMHDMAPVAAMKESFMGCLRNFMPFLVYGIVMTVLSILAVIPIGLGLLVWVPLAIASSYAAYRSIFTEGGSTAIATA
jgi:uncharacterized membrane protein